MVCSSMYNYMLSKNAGSQDCNPTMVLRTCSIGISTKFVSIDFECKTKFLFARTFVRSFRTWQYMYVVFGSLIFFLLCDEKHHCFENFCRHPTAVGADGPGGRGKAVRQSHGAGKKEHMQCFRSGF